jgi:superfamily II DNA or RNA helicase
MFHAIFQRKFANWEQLEQAIEAIQDTTEKGDVFEQFVYFYFTFFRNLYQIEKVYSPKVKGAGFTSQVKNRLKLEPTDFGVDGAYETFDGRLAAYQAKFRTGRASPSGSELATFWAEAEYADYRCIVANCLSLPRIEKKKKNALSILADRFLELDKDFFEQLYAFANSKQVKHDKPTPREYQRNILNDLESGLHSHDRGKLLAACGTGKTLVALWCTERINARSVLFLAPSLALIRQTLSEWAKSANVPFSYLCVCSDATVDSEIDEDLLIEDPTEIDVPVTTIPEIVYNFISRTADRKSVIFSTYQSLNVIREAVQHIPGFAFDICLFDEAHRTAGVKGSHLFAIAIDDSQIQAKKRLFMTATERLVKPWIREKVEGSNSGIVLSMDDSASYGTTFHRLGFGQAIAAKIISDYRIVLASIAPSEYASLIDENRYLAIDAGDGDEELLDPVTANELFKACLLRKCIQTLGIRKIISYHSRVRDAKRFSALMNKLQIHTPVSNQEGTSPTFFACTISGEHSAAERSQRFEEFNKSQIGILSNVRCLSEGIDLPITDAIFFADPRESLIDIVQAVGRTLRKPFNEHSKMAYVILPISIVDENIDYDNADLESLHSVIQALRDQDSLMGEWVNEINLALVQGRTGRKWPKSSRFQFVLPEAVNLERFESQVVARIAEVNCNPTRLGRAVVLGVNDRKSLYQGEYKGLGDYNYDKYESSLIRPTLEKYLHDDQVLSRTHITVNNNNVSHSVRLGILFEEEKRMFSLTKVGKLYRNNKINFERLFRNQMLLYSIKDGNGNVLLPYRTAFAIMKEITALNYIEFLYGLYAISSAHGGAAVMESAIARVQRVRSKYPGVMQTSDANQEAVRKSLNDECGVEFSHREVWTDRTTPGNRFRYFRNHMSLFGEIFLEDSAVQYGRLVLREDGSTLIDEQLESSEPPSGSFADHYGFLLWAK